MTINPVPLPPSLQPKAVIGETVIAEETPEIEETAEPEAVVEDKPKLRADELSDLFEVPQEDDNDMYTDDLFELDEEDDLEDDLSDLTSVSHEDIMGDAPRQKPRYRIVRPARRRIVRPPTTMGGMQY